MYCLQAACAQLTQHGSCICDALCSRTTAELGTTESCAVTVAALSAGQHHLQRFAGLLGMCVSSPIGRTHSTVLAAAPFYKGGTLSMNHFWVVCTLSHGTNGVLTLLLGAEGGG